jgi:DnaK suppressor protein
MDAARARELVAAERARIERALRGRVPVDSGEIGDADDEYADRASELYEAELDESLRAQLLEELAAVERAEARLEAGTYGISVDSGEAIPDERLEAVPTAERTAAEQARFDRGL